MVWVNVAWIGIPGIIFMVFLSSVFPVLNRRRDVWPIPGSFDPATLRTVVRNAGDHRLICCSGGV